MADLVVNGEQYRTGKLTAFQQFHIARRLAPVFFALGGVRGRVEQAAQVTDAPDVDTLLEAFEPLAEAVSQLSDADSEYVLKACFLVGAKQQGPAWAPLLAPNGALMFQDMDLKTMMQIVITTVQENLGGFFPGAQQPT